MSYSFAEASKDAERIENFLQRLTKAREIFKLVNEANVRIEQLKAHERTLESELKIMRSRYTSAETLTGEKVKAFGEVEAAAHAKAVLAQKDTASALDAFAEEVADARQKAVEVKKKLTTRRAEMNRMHNERVAEMERIERDKRAQIAKAESQRRAIIQQLSPEGD